MSQRYIGGLIYNPPGGFSGYFNGATDWLTTSTNTALALGSGDFTVECFAFITSVPNSYNAIYDNRLSGGSSTGFWIAVTSGRVIVCRNTSDFVSSGSNLIALNQWNHIAVVRSGSTMTIYLNGASVGSATASTNWTDNAFWMNRVNDVTTLNGVQYISNFRIVKGTALYTSAFTPPVGPLQAITNTSLLTCAYPTFRDGSSNNFTITVNGNTAVSTQNPFPQTQLPNPALGNQGNGVYSMSQYQALRSQNLWPAIDPYFDYVTLMLHGNGTNGAQNNTFLDSSTNNFTITRNGNTTQGTFTPYGSNWSTYINGLVAGAYLVAASSSATAFGTGNFTIEMWVNSGAQSNTRLAGNGNSGSWSSGKWVMATSTSLNPNKFIFACNNYANNADMLVSTTPSNDGAWHHIAVVRNSNTWTLYVDGVNQSTVTSSVSLDNGTANPIGIGYSMINGDTGYSGYISNFRMTNTAVYTSNFTPSTSNLTAITGTQLLTCQNSRWIDNSPNNLAITIGSGGNFPSVQRFSPFAPTTPYAAGTIGGSGYFDGSGDILSIANNAAFAPGTGDFTLECWAYHTTSSTATVYFSQGTGGLAFYRNASNQLELAQDAVAVVLTSTATIPVNAWTHVATSRSGTTLRLFINGSQVASATNSTNFSGSGPEYISASGNGSSFPMTGYISDIRLLKGTALYTSSTYTVPTAPLTNIANTSFLANFTNGGIIDNAMMNDLETVGNAQISTSVSKFGGGSMFFDGSGDWVAAPFTQNMLFSSGDFTIEGWFYNSASQQALSGLFSYLAGSTYFVLHNNNGTYPNVLSLYIDLYTSAPQIVGTTTLSTGLWYHFALTRASGVWRLFVNGVQQGSSYTNSAEPVPSNSQLRIGLGNNSVGTGGYTGYIDDFRITKGYARYTANFTPQRSQWQDQ